MGVLTEDEVRGLERKLDALPAPDEWRTHANYRRAEVLSRRLVSIQIAGPDAPAVASFLADARNHDVRNLIDTVRSYAARRQTDREALLAAVDDAEKAVLGEAPTGSEAERLILKLVARLRLVLTS